MVYVIIVTSAGDLAEVKIAETEGEAVVKAVKFCEEYKIDLTDLIEMLQDDDEEADPKTQEDLDVGDFLIGYGNQESIVYVRDMDFE